MNTKHYLKKQHEGTRELMKGGYRWLSKEERVRRNRFILGKKAEGWPLKRIAAQTNLAVRGVEEVIYVAKKRRSR